MERFVLTKENISDSANRAALVLQNNGVVLFPTDTLYGLGADALSNEAVDKVYAIKGRDGGKPIHALVSDIAMAERFAEIPEAVKVAIEALPKGKVTFICKKKMGLETGICRGIDTFGFRIPDNAFCLAMIEQFGGPVTATSANAAGMQPQRTVDAILEQLGHTHILGYVSMLDMVVDGGELSASQPSSVISLAEDRPRLLREAAVSASDIARVLPELLVV